MTPKTSLLLPLLLATSLFPACNQSPNLAAALSTTPSKPTTPAPLFSEDFEAPTLNPLWSQQITGNNTIALTTEKAAHGSYSLKISCPSPANKTWAFISTNNLSPTLQHHLFGRAYMFIAPTIPARHTIFLMAGTPGFPNNKFQEVATANAKWQLTYVDLSPTADREDYHAGPTLPTNRWICLEWEFNDHPNHATIWVDNTLAYETDFTSRTQGKSDLIGAFTNFSFGFRLWGDAPQPFDIYYDDIAIDTKRIGPINPKSP